MIYIIILIIIILLGLLAAVCAESFFMLRVRRESLGGDIKIAHISDLHKRSFGKENQRLCEKVAAEAPDVIFISGDLVSRTCIDFSAAKKTLEALCRIAPVYMVRGNHENELMPEYAADFKNIVTAAGAILLENETAVLSINDRQINICGVELKETVYKKNDSYRSLDTVSCGDIEAAIGKKPLGETFLLVHNPLFAEAYAEWGADYAVSGHVHGGSVCIPFTRIGVLSPERKFFPQYSKGVYDVNGMKLLLSGGLGKLRLFNPPEIVVYSI